MLSSAGNFSSGPANITCPKTARTLLSSLIIQRFFSGTRVAIISGMKKFGKEAIKDMGVKTPNHMAILAIVGEMARRVNENISKVDLKPLQEALSGQNAGSSASNS